MRARAFIALVALPALSACQPTESTREPCELRSLSIVSTDPLRNEIYAGRGGDIEVQFRNENAPTAADVFPEPRVTIQNRATGKSCDITDGGIWTGDSVYLDAAGRALVLHEYHTNYDSLRFFNPLSCEQLAQIDVSNQDWQVLRDRIRRGREELMLDSRCLARVPKR